VAFRGLDPRGYAEAIRLGGRELAPGVAVLRGYAGSKPAGRLASDWTQIGVGPVSPWFHLWLSPVVLVLLTLLGWPLARSFVPNVDHRITISLAPALGLAFLGLSSWFMDSMGFRLADGGGLAAVALTLAAGLFESIRRRAQESAVGKR
jgi:hypothetical protein